MFKKIVVLTLFSVFCSVSVAAQKTYKIMGDAKPGTKFRPVEATSFIPFDKQYKELTDQQKQIFRDSYGGLKDSEQPPFPKKGMEVIYKPIIKGHQRVSRGGNLFLVAMVDEKGKVENVAVYESPNQKISELATAVLFNTKFDPASCDGKPCKMEFPFEFKLRNKEKVINN